MTDITEKVFTQQKDYERMFAAAAFISPEYALEVCGWLNPEIIADKRVRDFWTGIKAGKSNIEAADDAKLNTEIYHWMNETVTSLYIRDYANQIARYSYLGGISVSLSTLAGAVGNSDFENVAAIIEDLAKRKPSGIIKPPTAEEVNYEFIQAVVSDNRSILTGIPNLDNNIGGLERQTMSILAARPSMGKTALALQVARNAARKESPHKVIFFSLEMSRISLWARAACPSVGLTWMDVKAKRFTGDQEERLFKESSELAVYYGDNLMIVDDPQTTQSVWQICANERPDLVVIDHLRLVKDKGDNEVKRQGGIAERMKDMSKELDCHVLICAQLNRSVEARTNNRPVLADLRDSGEIEETADTVFMMYREDYYKPPTTPVQYSQTELWIRKFRDGVKDSLIPLAFYDRRQWFEPIPGA